jgi:hypothetical protein
MSTMASDMVWLLSQRKAGSLIEVLIREYAMSLIGAGCSDERSGV